MCNCNQSTDCSNCCQGIPCNCPPVYPIPTTSVVCGCCINGYTWQAPTPNYPNGICIANNGTSPNLDPIPCVDCVDSIPTDCVTYTGNIPIQCGTTPGTKTNIYGILPGDSLTTIIDKMCIVNEGVLEAMLSAIGNSSRALAGLCHLVQACGSVPGVTTPVIGPISFSIP